MKRVLTLFVLLLTLTVGAWAVQPLYQLEYITQSDGWLLPFIVTALV